MNGYDINRHIWQSYYKKILLSARGYGMALLEEVCNSGISMVGLNMLVQIATIWDANY